MRILRSVNGTVFRKMRILRSDKGTVFRIMRYSGQLMGQFSGFFRIMRILRSDKGAVFRLMRILRSDNRPVFWIMRILTFLIFEHSIIKNAIVFSASPILIRDRRLAFS
jgi:hypothetical protein